MIKKKARMALALAICTLLQLFGTAVLAADAPSLPEDIAAEEGAGPQPDDSDLDIAGPPSDDPDAQEPPVLPAPTNKLDQEEPGADSSDTSGPDQTPDTPSDDPEDDEPRVTASEFDRTSAEISVAVENAPADTVRVELVASVDGEEKTYPTQLDYSGSYRDWAGKIDLAEFAYRAGTYTIVAKAVQVSGEVIDVGEIQQDVSYEAGSLHATNVGDTDSRFLLRATDVVVPEGVALWFSISTDDPAIGPFVAFANKNSGTGYVGLYRVGEMDIPGTHHASLMMGSSVQSACQIGSVDFVVQGLTSSGAAFTEVDGHTGHLRVGLSAQAPSGIEIARVDVWTRDDKSDLRQLGCAQDENGLFVTDNVAEHGGAYGTYHAETYVRLGNGMTLAAGQATCEIWPVNVARAQREDNGNVRITLVGPSPADVQFKVAAWSNANGQDDVVWYDASMQEDGTVVGTVRPTWHDNSGTYTAHVYAGDEAVAAIEFDVPYSDMLTAAEKRIQADCEKVYSRVGRDLYDNYMWVVNNFSYTRRYGHLKPPSGYTREQWYAVEGLETRNGNCYTFAASFAALARGLGYDAQYVEGAVYGVGQKWWPHGFVFIRMNGSTYICDPELQFASSRGRNLYMQPISSPKATYRW